MAQDISFGISGENAEFMRALQQSQAAVASASEHMKGAFEGISGVFESLTGALGVFTAALAGGAAFKEAVDTTVELTTGAQSLGRQFGISATQASDLRVALDDVHVSTETFQAAGNALVKTLNANEEAFNNAGIATRGASGELRGQLDIMLDAIDHLAKLKEGVDRNIEGQQLFGRAWAEVSPVVKLTSEAMREATEKAQALGLEVGGEQVTATNRYRAAMNDVSDVMSGIKNVIGQAVMPVLTTLGKWFGSIGPGLVETFRIAIATLATPFRLLALGIEVVYETGKTMFTQLAEYAITFAEVFNRAIRGDFSGAAQAWRDGMGRIQQIGNDYLDKMVKDAADTQKKIVDSFADAITGGTVTPTKAGDGGAAADSEARSKREMELLHEKIRAEDQHAEARLKGIESGLTASDLLLAAEQREVAAGQRAIALTQQEIHLNDQSAASRLKSIETQLGESERFLKGEERAAQRFQQTWGRAFNSIATTFGSAFGSMLRGSETFGEAMRNMFASIAQAAVENAAKNIAMMALQSAVGKDLGSAQIRKDAGEAAAGAYKAVVGIPYVGPFLAPAAAAVAYAGVLAFDSAAGGYDIPSGINPVVQTHSREMILPEEHADTIRNMGGKGGGRGQQHTLNVRDMGGGYVMVHTGNLAECVKQLGHQFKLPTGFGAMR